MFTERRGIKAGARFSMLISGEESLSGGGSLKKPQEENGSFSLIREPFEKGKDPSFFESLREEKKPPRESVVGGGRRNGGLY